MPKDTDLSDLIINKLTQAQFQELVNAGTVSETELYMLTDADVDVTVDNNSITKNSQNQIQTVGVINQNNTAIANKNWVGTRAEYEALVADEEIDDNTIYTITDDENIPVSILELLYPVGAIYIGTMATCPLQLLGIGTWQLVSAGRVLQGVNTGQTVGSTVDAGLPNPNLDIVYREDSTSSGVYTNIYGNTGYTSGSYSDTAGDDEYMQTSLGKGATAPFGAVPTNSIYGNSNTVQPPAYLVNIWERIS